MEILPGSSSVAELFGSDVGCSVALAKFKTRDSAPPMPRSRWMNTTSGCLVMVMAWWGSYRRDRSMVLIVW